MTPPRRVYPARHDPRDVEADGEALLARIRREVAARPPGFVEACGRVAEASAAESDEPVDVEEWSNRLAADLSKFSD